MFVAYNGIEFEMLLVEEWVNECVYDRSNTDHIYNLHTITAVCVLNRDVNDSSKFPQPKKGVRVGPAGTVPDFEKRLSTPRKRLQVYSYTNPQDANEKQLMVDCPKDGLRSDCLNGPHCRVIQILPIGGYSSYAARMQFTAAVPLCDDPYPPVMISNRWQMRVSLNDDYFTIREFDGIAHFRLDQLAKQNLNPKFFKAFFFYPVEKGFRRLAPEVVRNPAGDQVMYSWSDIETPYNYPGGIPYYSTRAEAMEYRTYGLPLSSARQFLDANWEDATLTGVLGGMEGVLKGRKGK